MGIIKLKNFGRGWLLKNAVPPDKLEAYLKAQYAQAQKKGYKKTFLEWLKA